MELLPAPLGPIREQIERRATSNENALIAFAPPKDNETDFTDRMCSECVTTAPLSKSSTRVKP